MIMEVLLIMEVLHFTLELVYTSVHRPMIAS